MAIEVKGLNELASKLASLTDKKEYKRVLGQSLTIVERSAKEKCPVDTGTLRRNITSDVKVENDLIIGEVFTTLNYAPFVEYGTGDFAENGDGRSDTPWRYKDAEGNWHTTYGQEPQPFMRPALQENLTKIENKFKQEVDNIVERKGTSSSWLE